MINKGQNRMAKKSGKKASADYRDKNGNKVNMSRVVRALLKEHGEKITPGQMVPIILDEYGIDMEGKTQYLSTLKSNSKRRISPIQQSDDPAVQRLHRVKQFVSEMGGIDQARKGLNEYAALIN